MNKKWGNIDPDFDNDNTINGWKLKVLDVEFFRLERPNMSSFDTDEIQTAINSSLALLDAECNGLIQEVWFITDVESKFYRTGKEKNYIREAAIMQTQYFINLGNDYTDGSTSFNASGISASFQRPLDKKNIAPGVFILLQKGRVYELQSYDLGGNNFGKKPTANSLVNYVQFGVGDVRYVSYNQMPYNRQEGSLLYVEKGEIKFFTVEQLDLTVPRAYLLWDKATKSFEDIHDVKDIAFFGNQLDNAITRQEAEELIAASPSGVSKEYVDDGLALKQNKLTAGTNITIVGDTISSSGGTTNGVTLDTDQTITGEKTFTKAITINGSDGKKYVFDTNTVGGLIFSAPNYIINKVGGKSVIGFYDNGYYIRCFNNRITEVGTPTANTDAANKKYVDDNVLLKQNKLTAGTNITITDDVISATGGGGSGDVTIDTAQNITGIKTFTNGIKNNLVEVDGKSLIIKNSNTAASYLEVESVYSGSGYKNWFGIQLFRTTGTSRSRLANLEIRQDDGLYIACVNDVSIQGSNIKFNNVRLQQVGAPTADYDAATKKYADDGLSLKVDKTEIAAIDAKLVINTNNITKNAADILLKADKTDVVDLTSYQEITGEKDFKGAASFYGNLYCFGAPADKYGVINKENLDKELVYKQNTLIAGTGIDITGDTISSTTVVSPDTALTSKTNTFEFRQVIKSGGSGLLDLQNSTGSVLNTTYDLASTSVKLTSPNTTSMTFTAKDFNFSDKEIKNVGTPITNKSAANKEYVDTNLALKADKLVVPINASADTSTTINDRVVKVVYKEYTSTGDSVVASTSAGFGYLNASIIRKKSDNSWGIVYNDEFNEVYITSSNQIRFNIKTLAGYTNEIKLTIQHN